jgi:hypothetical protein
MLLGDLLAQVEHAGANGNAAALIDDLSLLTQVAAVAAEEGSDPDSYVLFAVRRFERAASPDDWVSLMGDVSRDPDSGGACLRRIVQWALGQDRHSHSNGNETI